ncbi:MAG: DUF4390 domain-containing protein [Acidobacteria bacterium]|nr:DUF4390 domain-containing protein [Acidobacteriota bacterium]
MAGRIDHGGKISGLRISLLAPLLFLSAVPVFARDAKIQDLRVEILENRYQASFRVEGAFTPEVEERIASGLETSFRHRVRVYGKKTLWFDNLLLEMEVTTTVKFDSLTSQYTLSRRIDGELRVTEYTENPEEMRLWMSELDGIPLGVADQFPVTDRVYVKVKSNIRSRFFLFFIPIRWNTDWEMLPFPGLEKTIE